MSTHSAFDVKPNLFVIGAAKSGTTSLHHFLARHPDIFMSDPKEPGYFAEGMDYYPTDEEWYLGLFEQAADAVYRGESSTHYTKLPTYPGVAGRIEEYCASPRFIYLMRDPIDRAISHYWHNTRKSEEFRPMLRALEEGPEYRAYGDYAWQLAPYLRRFGREAVFVETFERLVSEPASVTDEIMRWLDLDPDEVPEEFPAKNTSPGRFDRFRAGRTLGEFIHESQVWDRISPLVPQTLKDVGKTLARERVDPSDHSVDEARNFLRTWARDAADRTSRLLGREFPEWTTTRGTR